MDESEANSSNIRIKYGGCANNYLLMLPAIVTTKKKKKRYEMSGRITTKDLTSCPTALFF